MSIFDPCPQDMCGVLLDELMRKQFVGCEESKIYYFCITKTQAVSPEFNV